MKIALIAGRADDQHGSVASAYPGDPAARIVSLATALADLGHQVKIYSAAGTVRRPSAAASTESAGIELIQAGPRRKVPADRMPAQASAFGRRLAGIWRHSAPDVVHANDLIGGLAALVGVRELGIGVVQTFGGLDLDRGDADQARLAAELAHSASAVLAATSDDLAALVRRGVPPTAITMVPAGVDLDRFRPLGPVARRQGRHRLLMFAPATSEWHVTAGLRVLASVPYAELVIATGGATGCRELTRTIAECGLRDRVTIVSDLSETQAPALIRSADIVFSPVGTGAYAMVAVEAMACGVPVIASAVGAQRDAVIHGTTGFLVQPADADQLTRRIRQLLGAPMLREGCGIAAAARAKARYAWERVGRETLAVYAALSAADAAAAA